MGRPGLTRHRKFKRLSRTLDGVQMGFGEILARGALELLWDSVYESGDDFLGDVDDVEAAAAWRGDRGVLAAALEAAGGEGGLGFIERADGRPGFRVHDLWDHAPDYVQRRAEREAERRARGETISSVRAAAGRKGGKARAAKQAQASGKQPSGTCQANGATPAPAPAPAPAPLVTEEVGNVRRAGPEAVVFTLRCKGRPEAFEVTRAQVEGWGRAYPAVDVMAELRKSAAWQEANGPKTHRGMAHHLVGWLSRAQDQAAHRRNGPAGPQRPPAATKPEDFAEEVPGGF